MKNSDVRIINLTSTGEGSALKGGFLPEKAVTKLESYHSYTRWGHSKLANAFPTKELAKGNPNIKSVAIHPGRVQTNLLNHSFENLPFTLLFQKTYDFFDSASVEKGAYNQL